MSENGTAKPRKDRRLLALLFLGALGILLLILGGVSASREDSEGQEEARRVPTEADARAYAEEVEERIAGICSQVRGAGAVRVAVTLKGGYRAVYATDSQATSGGYRNSTVLIGSGAGETAVLICYENPEIAGVGIVCEGGRDPAVRQSIVALVAATYGIGTNKIFVADGLVS